MAQEARTATTTSPASGTNSPAKRSPGALPKGRNSPQRAPLGLYAEQLSGTAFTAAAGGQPAELALPGDAVRARTRASSGSATGQLRSAPFDEIEPDPNRLRWDPLPLLDGPVDFVDGLYTVGGNGDLLTRSRDGGPLYAANRSMIGRYFVNTDGELLFVPQLGGLRAAHRAGLAAVDPARSP